MYLGNGAGGAKGDPNPDYDPNGYDYTVELSGGATNGQVQLFDPMFCATGDNGHGGSFGAGDHWTDHPPSPGHGPGRGHLPPVRHERHAARHAATTARRSRRSHYDPGTKTMGDFSGDFGTPANSTDANRQDCSTNPAHNQWVQLASGLRPGDVPAQREHDGRRGQRQRRRREPVLDLGQVDRRQSPRLRRWPDGRLRQHGRGHQPVLPRPDRGGPRRQDDGHPTLRPGRVGGRRVPPDAQPGRQRLQLRRRSTGRPTTAGPAPA